jgi:parallel beta-helix repeat protein
VERTTGTEDGTQTSTPIRTTDIPMLTKTPIRTTDIPTLTITPISGQVYYVAVNGDDLNTGSIEAPFKTFQKAVSVLVAGDVLIIRGGVYSETLIVDVSGDKGNLITVMGEARDDVVIDIEGREVPAVILVGDFVQFTSVTVKGAGRECVSARGNYQTVWNLTISDCFSSGIQLLGGNIDFFESKVYGTVLRNKNGKSKSWNSAVKVLVGGHDVVIRNNEVFGNWGEGIAVTRGARITVQGNTVYDNWGSNIYIDNSFDVLVEKNFSYCSKNAPLLKDGYPANAFAIGEEEYDGWGAKLVRVTILNNIGAFCKRGIGSWSAEVTGGGLDTIIIAHNTFWGNQMHGIGVYVDENSIKAQKTLIVNNIFHQVGNNHGYIEDATGITMDYNFWVGGSPKEYKRILGTHDLWGDVGLKIEPDLMPESFALGANSRAIGYGMQLDFVLDDFFGQERDLFPDLGAIEWDY